MVFKYDENFKLLTVDMEGDTVYYKEEKPINVINREILPFHIMITNGVFSKCKENSNQLYGGLKMNKCFNSQCKHNYLMECNNWLFSDNVTKCNKYKGDKIMEDNKMNKCFINQCGYHDTREVNYCLRYNNVTKCHIYLENNSIQLKPITNEEFNNQTQFDRKVFEEINEFKSAIMSFRIAKKYEELLKETEQPIIENIIEEFYDVIQSMLQLIIFEGLTLEEIIEGQEKHFEKLESRGWKFNG